MVSPQDGKSGISRGLKLMTSCRAGKDDFGARSCGAFAIGAVLLWLILSGPHSRPDNPVLESVVAIGWVLGALTMCGAFLLGIVFAVAGIGRAIWERSFPLYSIIGIILNLGPSGLLLMIVFFRA